MLLAAIPKKNSDQPAGNTVPLPAALVESSEKQQPPVEIVETVENGKMTLKQQRSIEYVLKTAGISLAELIN